MSKEEDFACDKFIPQKWRKDNCKNCYQPLRLHVKKAGKKEDELTTSPSTSRQSPQTSDRITEQLKDKPNVVVSTEKAPKEKVDSKGYVQQLMKQDIKHQYKDGQQKSTRPLPLKPPKPPAVVKKPSRDTTVTTRLSHTSNEDSNQPILLMDSMTSEHTTIVAPPLSLSPTTTEESLSSLIPMGNLDDLQSLEDLESVEATPNIENPGEKDIVPHDGDDSSNLSSSTNDISVPPPLTEVPRIPPPSMDDVIIPPPSTEDVPIPPPSTEDVPIPPPSTEDVPIPPPSTEDVPIPPPSTEDVPIPPPSTEDVPIPPPSTEDVPIPPPSTEDVPMPPPSTEDVPILPPSTEDIIIPPPMEDVPIPPPSTEDVPIPPPSTEDVPTPPPSTEDVPTPPPSTEDVPIPPPSTEDVPIPPPSTEDVPIPPPSTEDVPTPPPSTEDVPTPPPSTEDVPIPPPSTEDVPIPPPSTEDVPTPPPSTEDVPIPPPSMDDVIIPPPSTEDVPIPPPSTEDVPIPPPSTEDVPIPPPSTEDVPIPPPSTEDVPIPPPSTEDIIIPPPMEDVPIPPPSTEDDVIPPPSMEDVIIPPPPMEDVPIPPLSTEDVPIPPPMEDVPIPPLLTEDDVIPPPSMEDVPIPPPSMEDVPIPPPSTEDDVIPPPSMEDVPIPPPPMEDVPIPPLSTEDDVIPPPPMEDVPIPPLSTEDDVIPPPPMEDVPIPPLSTEDDVIPPPPMEDVPIPPFSTEDVIIPPPPMEDVPILPPLTTGIPAPPPLPPIPDPLPLPPRSRVLSHPPPPPPPPPPPLPNLPNQNTDDQGSLSGLLNDIRAGHQLRVVQDYEKTSFRHENQDSNEWSMLLSDIQAGTNLRKVSPPPERQVSEEKVVDVMSELRQRVLKLKKKESQSMASLVEEKRQEVKLLSQQLSRLRGCSAYLHNLHDMLRTVNTFLETCGISVEVLVQRLQWPSWLVDDLRSVITLMNMFEERVVEVEKLCQETLKTQQLNVDVVQRCVTNVILTTRQVKNDLNRDTAYSAALITFPVNEIDTHRLIRRAVEAVTPLLDKLYEKAMHSHSTVSDPSISKFDMNFRLQNSTRLLRMCCQMSDSLFNHLDVNRHPKYSEALLKAYELDDLYKKQLTVLERKGDWDEDESIELQPAYTKRSPSVVKEETLLIQKLLSVIQSSGGEEEILETAGDINDELFLRAEVKLAKNAIATCSIKTLDGLICLRNKVLNDETKKHHQFDWLHEAVIKADHKCLEHLVKVCNIPINCQSPDAGNSALHIAVRRMDWPITAKLITLGADPCIINSSSRSAIHMMALKCFPPQHFPDVQSKEFPFDLSSYVNNPSLSDAKLESSEGEEFYVHRLVLCGQSPVFKSMLESEHWSSDRQEGNKVSLFNISSKTLKLLLQYLYTGVSMFPHDDLNCWIDLLAAADQFLLEPLRLQCEKILSGKIDPEVVIPMLYGASRFGANKLLINCCQYLLLNYQQIEDTDNEALLYILNNADTMMPKQSELKI